MAFTINDFDANGSGSKGGLALHTYITDDTDAVVEGANYFDSIASLLKVGDIIFANMDRDGTPSWRIYKVTAITAGAVTIATFTDGTNDIV